MARITVEDCLTKETNRFALIHLSSKRTKQLLQGASVVLGEACDNKPVVTSLREIAEGKVRFMTQEEMDRLRELGLEEQVPGLEEAALQRAAAERAAKIAAAQEQAAAEKALAEEADEEDEKPSRNGNSENGHHAASGVSPDELAELADDLMKSDAGDLEAGDLEVAGEADEDDEEAKPAAAAEGEDSAEKTADADDAADSESSDSESGDSEDDESEDDDEEGAGKKTPGGEEGF